MRVFECAFEEVRIESYPFDVWLFSEELDVSNICGSLFIGAALSLEQQF